MELSQFGCKFEWYFYCPRCNCSCLTIAQIINMNEKDRIFGDRLDSDQFRGGKGPSQFVCLLSTVHTIQSRDTV